MAKTRKRLKKRRLQKKFEEKALERWGESSKRGGADVEVEVMKKRERVVAKLWSFAEKKQS